MSTRLYLVLGAICFISEASALAPNLKPSEIDPETIATFKRHGASFGSMSPTGYFTTDRTKPGYLPAFKFETLPDRQFPVVAVPFGLCLEGCKETKNHLQHLSNQSNLIAVNVSALDLNEDELKCLNPSKLQILNISESSVPIEMAEAIASFKNLVSLTFHDSGIDDRGIKKLLSLKKLERLDLSHSSVSENCIPDLKLFPQLTRLWLGYVQVTDVGFLELTRMKKLTHLHIGILEISEDTGKKISQLSRLQSLFISFGRLPDPMVAEISKLPHLTRFSFSDCSSTSLDTIFKMRKLTDLDLSRSKIASNQIANIIQLKELETLQLYNTPVDDDCVPFLIQLPRLLLLDIASTKISRGGLAQIQKALPKCKVKNNLHLQNP
jgi:internalin A